MLISDPWVTISSSVMVLLCAILGCGARRLIALDHRVRAAPRIEEGFPSRGVLLETIKGFYTLLVFGSFAAYIAFLRHRFGFEKAQYYVEVYAFSGLMGMPVAAWTMGFLKPRSVWEELKRCLSKLRRVV
jgi:hypothetical protein